jgi:hypothetical protein
VVVDLDSLLRLGSARCCCSQRSPSRKQEREHAHVDDDSSRPLYVPRVPLTMVMVPLVRFWVRTFQYR